MKHIIVTGASGFVGQYVVTALLTKGFSVLAIYHAKDGIGIDHPRYSAVTADIRKEEDVARIFSDNACDGVIHLAADIDFPGSSKTIETNCIGTYFLAQQAAEHHMKFFVYLSSIPVIGRPQYLPVTEAHPTAPQTIYHITKLAGEQIVDQLCRKIMHTVHLRISSPIGPNMNPKSFLSVLLQKCQNNQEIELYGQGLRFQNYIDVRDVAHAVVCAATAGNSGLFLIGGEKGITNRDLAQKCRELTKSTAPVILGKREDPEENFRWDISIEKAKRELDFWPAYTIDDSLQWILRECRKE